MASIWNANLTNAEIERYAFLYGNKHLADFAAEVEDQDDLETRHKQELEAAIGEAHAEGLKEGLGLDADKMIDALRDEVVKLKADHRRCRDNLQAAHDWLKTSDNHNTLVKRKAYADKVRQALLSTPRH